MILTEDPPKIRIPASDLQSETVEVQPSEATPLLAEPSLPPPPPYGAYSYDSAASEGPSLQRKQRSARARFCVSLGVALFLYFLGLVLLGRLMREDKHGGWHPPWDGSNERPAPSPKDGRVIQCDLPWHMDLDSLPIISPPGNPNRPPYSSSMTLRMSTLSPHLNFFARGAHARGSITFRLDDKLEGDDAMIDVISKYWSLDVRNIANVCLFENDEGGKRFGILTPQQRFRVPPQDHFQLLFEIVVRLPTKLGEVRRMGTLDTDLPSFYHAFLGLEGRVSFESISVNTLEGGIQADYISAHTATFRTASKPITGTFNVTEQLILSTTNAPIKAQVNMYNEHRLQQTSILSLRTTNAPIEATASLYSTDGYRLAPSGGYFVVDTVTTNGVIKLDVPQLPPTAHFQLRSTSSNGATSISLHPAYEGRITLRSTNSLPEIQVVDPDVPDPSGRGFRRCFTVNRVVKGAVDATVTWGPDKDHRELGQVTVGTTNSPVVLRI